MSMRIDDIDDLIDDNNTPIDLLNKHFSNPLGSFRLSKNDGYFFENTKSNDVLLIADNYNQTIHLSPLNNKKKSGLNITSSNVNINHELNVNNLVYFHENIESSNIIINGILELQGKSDFVGSSTFHENVLFKDFCTFKNNVEIKKKLEVNELILNENANFFGKTNFSNEVQIQNNLEVFGKQFYHDKSEFQNVEIFNGFVVNNNSFFNGNIIISGNLNVPKIEIDDLIVKTKLESFLDASFCNLQVNNNANIDNLTVNNNMIANTNVQMNKNLLVDGHSKLTSLQTQENANFNRQLIVDGNMIGNMNAFIRDKLETNNVNTSNIYTNEINVFHKALLSNLNVQNNSFLSNISSCNIKVNDIEVEQKSDFWGNVTCKSLLFCEGQLNVNKKSTFLDDIDLQDVHISNILIIKDKAEFNKNKCIINTKLHVQNSVDISDDLYVQTDSILNNVDVNEKVHIKYSDTKQETQNDVLIVDGPSHFKHNIHAKKDLTIDGKIITKDLKTDHGIFEDLTANNNVFFQNSLEVKGDTFLKGILEASNLVVNGNLNEIPINNVVKSIENISAFTVSNGNLGIWNENPTTKLHIKGDTVINGNLQADSFYGFDANRMRKIMSYTPFIHEQDGDIGIGRNATDPKYTLEVGDKGTESSKKSLKINGSMEATGAIFANEIQGFQVENVRKIFSLHPYLHEFDGRIGIGRNADKPETQLDVEDNATIRGTLFTRNISSENDLVVTSDINSKTDIKKITNSLEILENIHGYKFTLKNDVNKKNKCGLLAQEVEKTLPEVVHKNEDGKLGVSYGNIVGVLVEAIHELSTEIQNLKQIIGINK